MSDTELTYTCSLTIYQASPIKNTYYGGKYEKVIPENGVYKVKDGNHIKIKVEASGFWIFLKATPKGLETDNVIFNHSSLKIERFFDNDKQIVITKFEPDDWCKETGRKEEDMGKINIEITVFPYIELNGDVKDGYDRLVDRYTKEFIRIRPKNSRGRGFSQGMDVTDGPNKQTSKTALVEGEKSDQTFISNNSEIVDPETLMTFKTTLVFEAI